MKKTLFTLAVILMGMTTQMFAMSMSNIRTNARFLSDRMAYELDLTPMQYDDCYEINFDFIYAIDRIMDDVVYGYNDAIDQYYSLLDYRNEDLRFVLNARQYARFIALDYFYRPIYSTGRSWAFRIHTIYSNRSFFYFDAPTIYRSYRGGHSHIHYNHNYYSGRHHHEIHRAPVIIHGTPHMHDHGRHDFGTVRRERNDRHHNGINNYRNPNQHNRTQDHRYRDNSGNHNSPQINHRNEGGQRQPQSANPRHERNNGNGGGVREHNGGGNRSQAGSRGQGGTRSSQGGRSHEGGRNHEGGGHGGRR